MLFSWRKRKRFERVASLELPPGQWERAWTSLRRRDVLGRIGLALLAAMDDVRRDPRLGSAVPLSHGLTLRATSWPPWPSPKADPVATETAQQTRRADKRRYVYIAGSPSRWCNCGPNCEIRWSS